MKRVDGEASGREQGAFIKAFCKSQFSFSCVYLPILNIVPAQLRQRPAFRSRS